MNGMSMIIQSQNTTTTSSTTTSSTTTSSSTSTTLSTTTSIIPIMTKPKITLHKAKSDKLINQDNCNLINNNNNDNRCNAIPMAVFKCKSNSSHPFTERRLPLNTPVKVGRAVAKCKPNDDNAIFDCKVLSRNHALIWFEEGKFYLQDTKSSNGTFINSRRLSPANEDSQPNELYSGDVVQFGVDVIENSKKVTHGCIIATVKLLLPDGTEAKPHHKSDDESSHQTVNQNLHVSLSFISANELHQLSQYLSEANYRERMLENKLSALQKIISSAQQSADNSWKSLVTEDRLLSRIETLQNKLEVFLNARNSSNDKDSENNTNAINNLRDEIIKLHEEKENYESAAKEALQKALEDKLLVMERLHELENTLTNSELKCTRLNDLVDNSQKDIDNLTQRIDELVKEIVDMTQKLKKDQDMHKEMMEKTEQEKLALEDKINSLKDKEIDLTNTICCLKDINNSLELTIEQLRLQIVVMKQERVICHQGESQSDDGGDLTSNKKLIFSVNPTDHDHNKDNEAEIEKLQRQLDCSHATSSELAAQIELLKQEQQQKKNHSLNNNNSNNEVCNNAESSVSLSSMTTNGELDDNSSNQKHNINQDLKDKVCENDQHEDNENNNDDDDEEIVRNEKIILEILKEQGMLNPDDDDGDKELNENNQGTDETRRDKEDNQHSQEHFKEKHFKEKEDDRRKRPDNAIINKNVVENVSYSVIGDDNNSVNNSTQLTNSLANNSTTHISPTISSNSSIINNLSNLSPSQHNDSEVDGLKEQLEKMKEKLDNFTRLNVELNDELRVSKEEYEIVSYQNKIASACAIVPLIILFIAFIIAYYPSVSEVTGTTES